MKYRKWTTYRKWEQGEDEDTPRFEKIIRKTPRNDYAELDEKVKVKRQPRFWQQGDDDEETE